MGLKLPTFFSKAKEEIQPITSILGIDIGSSSIKVVEIEDASKALTLKTYGELQLGPYAQKELGMEVSLELSSLTEALVDIIRESHVKAEHGILAMPLSSSFVTVVPIIAKDQEELAGKINVEARKYIPIPLSDVTLDWSELKAEQKGKGSSTVYEVLLAAVQNDAFSEFKKLMSSVQMQSHPPEIEIFSTIRGARSHGTERFAIIDLGASTNKLYITSQGNLERIHRVPEGGSVCTARIAELLSVTFEEAENIKRSYREDDTHSRDVQKAFVATTERSIHEFKRVLDQYEIRIGEKITNVVICGGSAAHRNAPALIRDILSRDVTVANPFDKVAYPAFMEDVLKEIGPTFTTSLGAALRIFE